MTSPYEVAAVLFGIVAVYLTVRENVWCWPTGLVNVGLSILVFGQARLYADMGLQVVYVLLCLYGWYEWLHGGPGHGALVVTRTPRPVLLALAALGLTGAGLLGLALARLTDASLPFWDSSTTAFSLVAQYMQTRKWLENWIVWIAVDLVYLGIYTYKALYLMTGLYAVFLVLAVLGHLDWNRSLGALERLLRVVLTGSESTGKTTLAADLATHYGTVWSREFARAYVDRKHGPLDRSDVEPIARGQIAAEDEAARRASRLLVLDTDLLSTVVYARLYYGRCPEWVERAARRRLGDLYLLHHPDVPWVADGAKRDQPRAREQAHACFEATLREFGARYVDVRGAWPDRRAAAVAAIDAFRG